jgi:hypothetical protein
MTVKKGAIAHLHMRLDLNISDPRDFKRFNYFHLGRVA